MTEDTKRMVKPWDARLAYRLVYPLRRSWVKPNHLTLLRLLCGIFSLLLYIYSADNYLILNLASAFFVLSHFLDHTDGELARLTQQSSRFGHYLDLCSDAILNTGLFLAIGISLLDKNGWIAVLMGLVAGICIAAIFLLRDQMEQRLGKSATRQPNLLGFEAEDILYLLPLVTIFGVLTEFLVIASIGSPLFFLFVLWQFYTSTDKRLG